MSWNQKLENENWFVVFYLIFKCFKIRSMKLRIDFSLRRWLIDRMQTNYLSIFLFFRLLIFLFFSMRCFANVVDINKLSFRKICFIIISNIATKISKNKNIFESLMNFEKNYQIKIMLLIINCTTLNHKHKFLFLFLTFVK